MLSGEQPVCPIAKQTLLHVHVYCLICGFSAQATLASI